MSDVFEDSPAVIRRRAALSTELLLRRLVKHHGRQHYQLAVIVPNPLVTTYRRHLETQLAFKLRHLRTPFQRIKVAVCHEFSITPADLMGASRKPVFTTPRHVAMHLATKHTPNSRAVGRLFGKDHTCVLLANRKMAVAGASLTARVAAIASYI